MCERVCVCVRARACVCARVCVCAHLCTLTPLLCRLGVLCRKRRSCNIFLNMKEDVYRSVRATIIDNVLATGACARATRVCTHTR